MQDVKKQSLEVADKLRIPQPPIRKQDRFTRQEEGLEKEVEEARTLLDGVTSELKQGTLKATPELARSLELLEKVVADREEGAKDRLVSPVDPDARAGKKTGKSWAGYKGHLVVEEESEIITAIETTPANTDDGSQLKPLLKQQKEAYSGLAPQELSGDKAYDSGANLEHLDGEEITGYISLMGKTNHVDAGFFTVEDFRYDEANDTLTCPAGNLASYHRRAVFNTEEQKKRGSIFQFHPEQCNSCKLKHKCNKGNRGRAVYISYYHPLFQQMKTRMESELGKEAYRNRYKVEHKIADLARYCGMRRCRYRGMTRARIHTLLAAIVSNIKRMARLLWELPDPPPKLAVAV